MKSETALLTETALITGPSSGIGFHLAMEFARRRHALVLIAPVASELQKIASELKTVGALFVRTIAKDLEKPEAQQEISVLRLNIEAVLRLTKLFLPPMLQRRQGRILNVASVAGFEPGPLFAVYHASKAFVLSLTEALATELEGTGVTATALCPGPTDTDFFQKSGMLHARMFQKANLMAPQDVAKAGYEGLMAGERVVVPGVANKIIVFSRRLLPEATLAKMTGKLYVDTSDGTRERGDKELQA